MSALPAPEWETRVELIAPAGRPRWDWRHYARRVWQVAAAVTLGIFLVMGVIAALSDPPKAPKVVLPPGPDQAAEGYARQVARVWWTYSPATRDERRAAVAALMPGAAPDIGWDGTSTSTVSDLWTTSDTVVAGGVHEVHVAVITNAVTRLLVVRVGLDAWGNPYLAQFPTVGSQPAVGHVATAMAPAVQQDNAAQTAAAPVVEGFLRAWGTGATDPPARVYAAPGWVPPPGPGMARMVGTPQWVMPTGGSERTVNVLVHWADSAGRDTPSSYALVLTSIGDHWAVTGLDAAQPGVIDMASAK